MWAEEGSSVNLSVNTHLVIMIPDLQSRSVLGSTCDKEVNRIESKKIRKVRYKVENGLA